MTNDITCRICSCIGKNVNGRSCRGSVVLTYQGNVGLVSIKCVCSAESA